jgi:predicted adenine nucleotide alpha hydrolase (AANH) superfamily ATPase
MELMQLRILVHVCCAPCFTSVHKTLIDGGHDVVGFFYNPNIHPYQEFQKRLQCLERYTALEPVEVIYDKEYNLDKYLVGSLKAKYDPPPELLINKNTTNPKKPKTQNGFKEEIKMKESLQIQLIPKDSKTNSETKLEIEPEPGEQDTVTIEITAQTSDSDFHPRCGYCIRLRLNRTASVASEKGFDAFTTTLLESKYQPHEYIKFIGESLADKYGIKFYYKDFRAGWKESVRISKELDLYRQPYCGCIFSEYERFGPEH